MDGVLLRGSRAIPRASKALSLLQQENVPFIVLTNGGGVSEASRAEKLSLLLNLDISPYQIVQSHTPMRAWAQMGTFRRVMVVGGDKDYVRHVARDYGFADVILPIDVVKAYPAASPHHRFLAAELAAYAEDVDLDGKIDAVLVFNDPRDMGTDVQIVLDLLNSDGGIVGTRRPVPVSNANKPAIPIAFSNVDYLWANDYPLPRFGQGAFKMMLERLYLETNGLKPSQQLESNVFGKPYSVQHDYAHWVLIEWHKIMHGHAVHDFMPKLHKKVDKLPFTAIYMVGDNPALDIAGANASGWKLMLLRTGVYRDEDWESTKSRPSEGVFDDVLDAVEHGLAQR